MFNMPSKPFQLYSMEQEGVINTPEGKRNRFIKEVRSGAYDFSTLDCFRQEATAAGLTLNEIENLIQELLKGR